MRRQGYYVIQITRIKEYKILDTEDEMLNKSNTNKKHNTKVSKAATKAKDKTASEKIIDDLTKSTSKKSVNVKKTKHNRDKKYNKSIDSI